MTREKALEFWKAIDNHVKAQMWLEEARSQYNRSYDEGYSDDTRYRTALGRANLAEAHLRAAFAEATGFEPFRPVPPPVDRKSVV